MTISSNTGTTNYVHNAVNDQVAGFLKEKDVNSEAIYYLALKVFDEKAVSKADTALLKKCSERLKSMNIGEKELKPQRSQSLWNSAANLYHRLTASTEQQKVEGKVAELKAKDLIKELDEIIKDRETPPIPPDIVGEIMNRSDAQTAGKMRRLDKASKAKGDARVLESLSDTKNPLTLQEVKLLLQNNPGLVDKIKGPLAISIPPGDATKTTNSINEIGKFIKDLNCADNLFLKMHGHRGYISLAGLPPSTTKLTIENTVGELTLYELPKTLTELSINNSLVEYIDSTDSNIKILNLNDSRADSPASYRTLQNFGHIATVNGDFHIDADSDQDIGQLPPNIHTGAYKNLKITLIRPYDEDKASRILAMIEGRLPAGSKATVTYYLIDESDPEKRTAFTKEIQGNGSLIQPWE